MPINKPDRTADRFEGVVLVAILILVAGFAGAASFTHVKDWTLANSPHGTGQWFGWANAVISELVPVAALLTIRRRRRTGAPIGYPMFLLIAAAGLSLSAQLAVAKPGPSGWLLSAVPALAFMALVKLILAPVKTSTTGRETTEPTAAESRDTTSIDTSWQTSTHHDNASATMPTVVDTTPATVPVVEPAPTTPPAITPAPEPVTVPAHLLPTARFAVVNHEQTTGRSITVDELAARMSVTPAVAGQLLATINPSAVPPARINGTPVAGGVR